MDRDDNVDMLRAYFAVQVQKLEELIKEKQTELDGLVCIRDHLVDHISSNPDLLTDDFSGNHIDDETGTKITH